MGIITAHVCVKAMFLSCLCVCLSVCLCVYVSVCLCVCVSIRAVTFETEGIETLFLAQ